MYNKRLFLVTVADDVVGEAQGMFDAKGQLIHAWSLNDCNWRNEYLSPLMRALSIDVKDSTSRSKTSKDETPRELKKLKEFFGL